MRGIPTRFWDYFIDVNCDVYEKDTINKIGNIEANKNALTILNMEDSPYLHTDFGFRNEGDYYTVTGYYGSDEIVMIPSKVICRDNDDCVYYDVKHIDSYALQNLNKIFLPKTIQIINQNAVSDNTILYYEGTETSSIINYTDVTIHPYSETYSSNAWHYDNQGNIKLWADTITIFEAVGGNECAKVTFSVPVDAEANDYRVYYKKVSNNNATAINSNLVLIDGTTATAYIMGLEPGCYQIYASFADYSGQVDAPNFVYVSEQDRSGYAHNNYNSGVGAYNDNGTLKADTQVIYVTDATKNTVVATFDKEYVGLGNILKNISKATNPVCIRFLDEIKTAQWNQVTYTQAAKSSELLTAQKASLGNSEESKIYDYTILENHWNSYSDDLAQGITVLDGLNSYASYSSGKYDSSWNMLDIKDASNITIEGIGEDAGLFQWGLNVVRCNSIEIKNLTFNAYTEDGLGIQGTSGSESSYGNYWIHNCTFNQGVNRWDLSYEKDKYDGDGSTDFKYAHGLTISYCVYNNTHG